jgi:hypothetical protein
LLRSAHCKNESSALPGGPVLFRAKLVSPVLRSGLAGDYVAWMVVGLAALALAVSH